MQGRSELNCDSQLLFRHYSRGTPHDKDGLTSVPWRDWQWPVPNKAVVRLIGWVEHLSTFPGIQAFREMSFSIKSHDLGCRSNMWDISGRIWKYLVCKILSQYLACYFHLDSILTCSKDYFDMAPFSLYSLIRNINAGVLGPPRPVIVKYDIYDNLPVAPWDWVSIYRKASLATDMFICHIVTSQWHGSLSLFHSKVKTTSKIHTELTLQVSFMELKWNNMNYLSWYMVI